MCSRSVHSLTQGLITVDWCRVDWKSCQHAYNRELDQIQKRKDVNNVGLRSEESAGTDTGLDCTQCFERAISRTLGCKLV